ncbi:helix-turn-helix domain-containing protein [Dialister hominis]|uniref:helix-turn-helix domain-containing protein n=1 Tax=Dialister hominis TaxID=2582419 RepID=UPI003521A317
MVNRKAISTRKNLCGYGSLSVKYLCTGIQGRPPRLTNEECRKSENSWRVTRQGMERLYGPEIK